MIHCGVHRCEFACASRRGVRSHRCSGAARAEPVAVRDGEKDPWLANTRRQIFEHWPKITMTSEARMRTTTLLLTWISQQRIAGDVAEAGVWRGGHALFMSLVSDMRELNSVMGVRPRRVWLLDSFEGFGHKNEGIDEVFNRVNNSAEGWYSVISLFRGLQVLDSRVVFVRGFYEDRHSPSPSPAASPALELNSPKGDCLRSLWKVPPFVRLALLRVDCDMYSSIAQAQDVRVNIRKTGADAMLEARRRGPRPMQKTSSAENVGDVWWQKRMESKVADSRFCLEKVVEPKSFFCIPQVPEALAQQPATDAGKDSMPRPEFLEQWALRRSWDPLGSIQKLLWHLACFGLLVYLLPKRLVTKAATESCRPEESSARVSPVLPTLSHLLEVPDVSHELTRSLGQEILVMGGFTEAGDVDLTDALEPMSRTWQRPQHLQLTFPRSDPWIDLEFGVERHSGSAWGAWRPASSLSIPTSSCCAFRLAQDLYVLGGRSRGLPLRAFGRSVAAGPFAPLAPAPTARWGAAGATVQGQIFVCGGYNGGLPLDSLECYDPLKNAWAVLPCLPTPRKNLCCVAVSPCSLYLLGGSNGLQPTGVVEAFELAQRPSGGEAENEIRPPESLIEAVQEHLNLPPLEDLSGDERRAHPAGGRLRADGDA
eukprot:g3504.t1